MSGKLPSLGVLLLFCMGTISNASDTRVIGTSNTLPGEGTMSSPYQLTVNCGASSTDSFNYTLPASTSKYFALSVAKDSCASPSPAHSPRFIEVYMERTTPNGDPDLHVTACPTQTATSFPTIHYQDCNVSIGRDMTSQAVHSVSAAIGTWADTQDKMTFLVEIRGYGNTQTAFSMNAVSTTCHASVMWEPLSVDECGGDQRGTCSAAGECACKQASAPYPPTDHWVLDDCSALERPEIVLNKASNYTVNHGITNFVPFQVPNNTFELVVDIVTITGSPVETTLFVGGSNGTYKWIPSTHNKDRSAIRFVLTSNTPGSDSELQTYGLWALRLAFLNTTDPADSTKVSIVSLQVSENSCPGNCSGHGVCNTTTHTCNCEQDAWAGSDCSSPVQIATPDELHYTSNDHHIVPGTNLAGKQFELEQEKHLTVALNLSWAPTGTSFVINVTGLPNPHSDVWCPAYPVVQVGREPFDGDLAPDGGLECYGSNKHISKTVCGNDFHPGEGMWYVTVYAAGFSDMNFTMSAMVIGDKEQAVAENAVASLSECQTSLTTITAKELQCEADLHSAGGSNSGVSSGIAALLFFIGAFLGVAAGLIIAKFVLIPKGLAGFAALEPSTPSGATYANSSLSFVNKSEGGAGLLGNTENSAM